MRIRLGLGLALKRMASAPMLPHAERNSRSGEITPEIAPDPPEIAPDPPEVAPDLAALRSTAQSATAALRTRAVLSKQLAGLWQENARLKKLMLERKRAAEAGL